MSLYPAESAVSALKVTVPSLIAKKRKGERISCLTAYDYPFARLLDESGIDMLLVGDSWGMTAAGYESTLPVTMEEMLSAIRAVRRAARRALVVGDLPYGSYHLGRDQAVTNAIRMVKEAGAEAVKLEGGENRADVVHAIVEAEVPVIGHIGLTPQSVNRMGGYSVQGTNTTAASQLMQSAIALQGAGAFALVLEGIPRELASEVTHKLDIPTIGIGAGPDCDGQVLVLHDLLGLSFRPKPKFVRPYANLAETVRSAAEAFRHDVESGSFPADAESYHQPVGQRTSRRA